MTDARHPADDAATTDWPPSIVLCGGRGTRLASVVGSKPKCLAATVKGSPVVEYALAWLFVRKCPVVVLCPGPFHKEFKKYLGYRWDGMELHYARERNFGGTLNAIGRALRHCDFAPRVPVLNGDTLLMGGSRIIPETLGTVSVSGSNYLTRAAEIAYRVIPRDDYDGGDGTKVYDPDLLFCDTGTPNGLACAKAIR